MLIKTLPVGDLETNCYIVTNEQTLESVVIDPPSSTPATRATPFWTIWRITTSPAKPFS